MEGQGPQDLLVELVPLGQRDVLAPPGQVDHRETLDPLDLKAKQALQGELVLQDQGDQPEQLVLLVSKEEQAPLVLLV